MLATALHRSSSPPTQHIAYGIELLVRRGAVEIGCRRGSRRRRQVRSTCRDAAPLGTDSATFTVVIPVGSTVRNRKTVRWRRPASSQDAQAQRHRQPHHPAAALDIELARALRTIDPRRHRPAGNAAADRSSAARREPRPQCEKPHIAPAALGATMPWFTKTLSASGRFGRNTHIVSAASPSYSLPRLRLTRGLITSGAWATSSETFVSRPDHSQRAMPGAMAAAHPALLRHR